MRGHAWPGGRARMAGPLAIDELGYVHSSSVEQAKPVGFVHEVASPPRKARRACVTALFTPAAWAASHTFVVQDGALS